MATRAIELDETSSYPWVALGQAYIYNEEYDNALTSLRN